MLGTTALQKSEGYRSPSTCEVAGITYRQLDYWARVGLIVPSVTEARGSGTARLYSAEDVFKLHILKTLLDSGVSLQCARRLLEMHPDIAQAARRGEILLVNSDYSELANSAEALIELLVEVSGCVTV